MPTHAQQTRRRLAALGAEVTDTSPRGGLHLTALLPAGTRWAATGAHELRHEVPVGQRETGFTALLDRIKTGTFECTEATCERCGRTAPTTGPTLTVAISGKAMTALTAAGDITADPADSTHQAVARAADALRTAERHQRGKGFQYRITCDAEAAAVLAGYCQSLGERYATLSGPDDGTALITAAERLRAAITAATTDHN